jgi:hypothetical protein
MPDEGKRTDKPRGTALEEVLGEIEDAEPRDPDPDPDDKRHRHDKLWRGGEAADAITPNTRAQEESEGD